MFVQNPFHQSLDFAAAGLPAEQARLHNLGIIKDQHVAGRQQLRQTAEIPILQNIRQGNQQAAAATFGGRMLRDKVFGQVKIEIGKLHKKMPFEKSGII